MNRFWRIVLGLKDVEPYPELRRDPDLDLVKHMAEDHEYRLQLMERDLERISGGTTHPTFPKGADRRQNPRH